MAKKPVVWTETAIKQRREILRYWKIRNKSTAYSEKLIILIYERFLLISNYPEAGKATNHLVTREAAMGNFSIYYKNEFTRIVISSFWDNRQNPENLYKSIKK